MVINNSAVLRSDSSWTTGAVQLFALGVDYRTINKGVVLYVNSGAQGRV